MKVVNNIIAFLKSHWTVIVAIVGAVWGVVGTQIQMFVAANHKLSWALAMILLILAHLSPSPQSFWTSGGKK